MMIEPRTNRVPRNTSRSRDTISRSPPGPQPASLPFRPDQRAQVSQAARGGRRHRPGDGQSHRSSGGVGHRKALRGGPRSRNHRYSAATGVTTSVARSPIAMSRDSASSSTLTKRSSPRSARRKDSATCAWRCWDQAILRWCPAPSFPIHIHAIALASANVISLDVRDGRAFSRTSPGRARACSRGRRSWSSTIPTTRRRRWSTGLF